MRPHAQGLVAFVDEHGAELVPAIAEELVEQIRARNPAYGDAGPVSREDLFVSCRDNVARILQLLALTLRSPIDDLPDSSYDAARATGTRRAVQQLALDEVLGSFRLGGRLIWGTLIARAQEAGALDAAGMTEVGSRLWEIVDATSAEVAAAYHRVETERVRADEQRRAALWEDLLTGSPEGAADAGRALGLPTEGRFVVAVVSDEDGSADAFGSAGVQRHLAGQRLPSAWQRRAGTCVGIVDASALEPGEAAAHVAAVLAGETRAAAGVSAPFGHLRETGEAHRSAGLAHAAARAAGPAALTLDACLPEALLLRSPALADRLVDLVLGPVLARPDVERVALLETLEAWVAAAGSVTGAADLAHCHRNTVLNRLRRLRELTGRDDLREGRVPAEVDLALRALALRS